MTQQGNPTAHGPQARQALKDDIRGRCNAAFKFAAARATALASRIEALSGPTRAADLPAWVRAGVWDLYSGMKDFGDSLGGWLGIPNKNLTVEQRRVLMEGMIRLHDLELALRPRRGDTLKLLGPERPIDLVFVQEELKTVADLFRGDRPAPLLSWWADFDHRLQLSLRRYCPDD